MPGRRRVTTLARNPPTQFARGEGGREEGSRPSAGCLSAVSLLSPGCLSAVSRLSLGCVSAASRLPLGCLSAVSRLPLGCLPAVSRMCLGCVSAVSRLSLGYISAPPLRVESFSAVLYAGPHRPARLISRKLGQTSQTTSSREPASDQRVLPRTYTTRKAVSRDRDVGPEAETATRCARRPAARHSGRPSTAAAAAESRTLYVTSKTGRCG